MKGNAFAVAFVAIAVTACNRTELAAQPSAPSLTALGQRTTYPYSETSPTTIPNPCTGEILSGIVTFSGYETVVIDASGGLHGQVRLTYSATYTNDAGTTFTESGQANRHLNLPSSGVVNGVAVYNSMITGSDGTAFLAKERLMVVMDANGIVRVERNNLETNAYRCKQG